MRVEAARLSCALVLLLATGCSSEPRPENEAPPPAPASSSRPPRHTWDDDEIRRIDFPENTTPDGKAGAPAAAPQKPREPARPNVLLALSVHDVISWDDVKIRGGLRGSAVRGVVSLTGWLAKSKGASRTEQLVASGREGQLDVAEPLRALTGGTASFRVAILDANEKGELELAVTALASATDDAQVAPATRVRLAPGEALVVGGHRSEEGESPKKDQLLLIEATAKKK